MTSRDDAARDAARVEALDRYSHARVRDRYDADLLMAGFEDGDEWRREQGAERVRELEAHAQRLRDECDRVRARMDLAEARIAAVREELPEEYETLAPEAWGIADRVRDALDAPEQGDASPSREDYVELIRGESARRARRRREAGS